MIRFCFIFRNCRWSPRINIRSSHFCNKKTNTIKKLYFFHQHNLYSNTNITNLTNTTQNSFNENSQHNSFNNIQTLKKNITPTQTKTTNTHPKNPPPSNLTLGGHRHLEPGTRANPPRPGSPLPTPRGPRPSGAAPPSTPAPPRPAPRRGATLRRGGFACNARAGERVEVCVAAGACAGVTQGGAAGACAPNTRIDRHTRTMWQGCAFWMGKCLFLWVFVGFFFFYGSNVGGMVAFLLVICAVLGWWLFELVPGGRYRQC